MRLTKRNSEILETISKFQSMTGKKIARLYGLNEKNCQRILRLLCNSGFLSKMKVPSVIDGKPPSLFYLSNKGAELLGVKPSKPRLNYEHTHMQRNVDIIIDIILAIKETDIMCLVMSEHQIRTQGQEVIPDGVMNLKRKKKSALFMIECDYGTEILKSTSGHHTDIENKLNSYLNLFENNCLAFYENHYSQKFNRFRTLFVCSDRNRMNAISHLLTDRPFHFIWLTTLSDLSKKSILGNIFYVPSLNKHNLSVI